MSALNFKARFVPMIESGEKHQTIRALRLDGRNPKKGDTLYLYTGMRTKNCRKLKEVVCKSVEQITIEECSTIIFVGVAPLTINQMIKMSKSDGFETLYDFVDFFRKTHSLPFHGLLIKW